MVLNLLKNVFFTGLLVVGATIAGVTTSFVAAMLLAAPPEQMPEPALMTFGVLVVVALAMLAGMFFSVGTLFAAALTMPPVLWMARVLRLPRPLVDIVGGGAVAALCVTLALEDLDGTKLSDLATAESAIVFKVVGVLAGCLAGYVRHTWLVRPRQAQPAFA